jgi:hypothetical protein
MLLSVLAPSSLGLGQSADANGPPALVEVYWQSSRTIVAPGITNLIVLDPDIARAETAYDSIRFFGLARGETVALGYLNDKPVSIRIRVIPRPVIIISPAMLRRQSEMAAGMIGSNVQVFNTNGSSTISQVNSFAWSQLAGKDGQLDINGQVEDNNYASGHAFNIRNGSISYRDPGLEVHVLDYVVSLTNNGSQRYLSPYAVSDSVPLRGAAVTVKHGNDQFLLFGGTTIPFYYLTLGTTRDIGGFSWTHKLSDQLSLFSTTSYINTPTNFLGLSGRRQDDYMETGGFTSQLNKHWTVSGTGGISNHGGLGRAEADYIAQRLTFFVAGSKSSILFPLNQVFFLFNSNTSIKAGLTLKKSERLTESVYYQHALTDAFTNVLRAGSTDYLSPSVSYRINRAQDLVLTYTYSRNSGGFANQVSTGNRVDGIWTYRWTPQIVNNAELSVGSVQDPLQINSEDEFTVRDSFSFPVKGGNLLLAFQHTRRDPSLVSKLRSELSLLSPGLQTLFLQDPVAFVQSNSLPPDVRALLDAQVPIDTSFYVSGQFPVGKKLTLAPNFAVARSSSTATSWTPLAGYNLIYQAARTLQLTSGLTNIWTFNGSSNAVQRTTLFSFGVLKTFSVMPSSLLAGSHGGRLIEGRVFRDANVNGAFNVGERGYAGISVDLDNGQSVMTDEQGRYRFTNAGAGEHRVSLSLTQFAGAVRMTTQNQVEVDLIRQRVAVVDFGIVDFARLMGHLFNDARFEGKRQPDSKGLGDVHLVLDDGEHRRVIPTESNGDFEVDDVPPGDYRLTVDTSTMPANYSVPADTFMVHIAPVSTVLQDIPVRALRSISGRVLLKVRVDQSAPPADQGKISGAPQNEIRPRRGLTGGRPGKSAGQGTQTVGSQNNTADYNLVPIAGIQLSAGYGIATSDENGNFLLRDLPAGDLTITVVPIKPLPPDMNAPSGVARMPVDPVQVQGATIVIGNPDLLPYLVGKTAKEVRDAAMKVGSY